MARALSRSQSILLGTVVLLALALAGLGLFVLGSRDGFWSETFVVRTSFREVRGVEKGTKVRLQGIEAGEVDNVLPPQAPGESVVLRLRLKKELRHLVRSDARVQIVSENMLGGKVLEIRPGTKGDPIADDALLASQDSLELNDVLGEVSGTLQGLRKGEGPLGKEVLDTVQQAKSTLNSMQETLHGAQQVVDAGKRLPWFRNYVKDQHALLVRSNHDKNTFVFAESELFEPLGTALTGPGRAKLDELVPKLSGLLRHDQAELVVVAYADPKQNANASLAATITDRQAEAVCQYLREKHKLHKSGFFSTRSLKALGLGVESPVLGADPALPAARLELIVFVPQK